MDPNQPPENLPEPNPNTDENQGPKESPIAPEAMKRRRPVFNPLGRVEDLTAEETKVADIRRHPFGLFLIYLQTIVALGLSFILIFAFLDNFLSVFGLDNAAARAMAYFMALVVLTLGLLFLVLATRIYEGNQLIITNINVTQVLQVGLFNRKISELSMENVEDVTAQQHGIFQTLFNYGTLKIETAGEQNNFIFPYCPNPNAYAKALLDARQHYLADHPG